jgi:tetratricopeptide (TPR) repeat protein
MTSSDSSSNYKEAIDYFNKTLDIDPNYVNALTNKGASLPLLGKYEKDIQYYNKALAIIQMTSMLYITNDWHLISYGNGRNYRFYYDKESISNFESFYLVAIC